MIFRPAGLDGAWLIEPERIRDERGYFARTWCAEEFADYGIRVDFLQCSTSFNERRGTLRGIHLQTAPFAEAKLVRCTRGSLFDVMVDLRADSGSFGRWRGVELSADNGCSVYLPAGFGHGFQTLEDRTEIAYHISAPYEPSAAAGVHWDDADLAIDWPDRKEPILSDRDQALPPFSTYAKTIRSTEPAARTAAAGA